VEKSERKKTLMLLKKSYYTIFSDVLNDKEDRVIFSTRTSQAFIVKKEVYDMYEAGDFMSLPQDVLEKFIQCSMAVPEDENELLAIVEENKKEIRDDTLMYESIQPSAMCQLGCDYCGQDHKKVNMGSELYDNLVQRLNAKAEGRNFRKLYIGWFGAEPLMGLKQIRELTPLLKDFCRQRGMNYGAKIVTNGLSLKENIFYELVNELSIDHVEITLDGTALYHDQRRHTKEKGATFDIILNNILSIVNNESYDRSKVRLTIRCNVDERNYEGVLPKRKRGYYHEFTVKTPGTRGRGARRIITGGEPASSGEYYYTDDHYATFKRIEE